MDLKNVLIFPCGSECGLEILNALQYEKYVRVFGASSEKNNPGPFVYENYIEETVPFISDDEFIKQFNNLLAKHNIDFVFPALDSVALHLAENKKRVSATVIGSPFETNHICRSKQRTYQHLKEIVAVPELYDASDITESSLPLFVKPDIGQGSEGVVIAEDLATLRYHAARDEKVLIMQYLPGKEYTIDCFTDRNGTLRFTGGRERRRIKAGIAVNSVRVQDRRFAQWAEKINAAIPFRGAWFYQVKESASGEFVLLEVAPRIAGTSALARNRGVNLPLLSIYDAMDMDVTISENATDNEIDRTFTNRFRIDFDFRAVYCDFDDCLIVRGEINTSLVEFLFRCLNRKKEIILLTRHGDDIMKELNKYRLAGIFDDIIHITDGALKSKYLTKRPAIFIDDSHREREDARQTRGVVSLAPDGIDGLVTSGTRAE